MRDLGDLFAALAHSPFRRKFRLNEQDARYLRDKGLDLVLRHADDFISQRLAPAKPANDGKQTPWKGHPVFVAQHATGACCRGCLAKWHGIEKGRELTAAEREYVVGVIRAWIERQAPTSAESSKPHGDSAQRTLF